MLILTPILLRGGKVTNEEGNLKVISREVPVELRPYTGSHLNWLEIDHGGWGNYRQDERRKGDGPVAELIRHLDEWVGFANHKRVCLQAGGNLGLYPKVYSHFFDKVYTFEPDKVSFDILVSNIKDRSNINYSNKALSSKSGWAHLNVHNRNNNGTHRIVGVEDNYREEDAFTIQSITIDSLEMPVLDLIHLDVEGHEEEVIMGAKETIKRCRPAIILETCSTIVSEFLTSNNYMDKGRYQDIVFVPL